ncbi:hypothetical protein [Flindersiella endophytica]
MRRTVVLLVAVAFALAGLTSCAGGDDKYCGLLEQADKDKTLSGTANMEDPKVVDKVIAKFKEIGDAAPGDIEDEWKSVNDGMAMVKDPAKVDPKEAERLGKDMETALETLEKDAKDRCGVDLS